MGVRIDPDGWPQDGSRDDSIPDYSADCYDTSLSEESVERYLRQVAISIRKGSFIVETGQMSESRKKNSDFMVQYGLSDPEEQKALLLSISASEFCHVKHTEDGRDLYVFCPRRSLYKTAAGNVTVSIYVKHDYAPGRRMQDVVISLHELEFPIYLPYAD